MTDWVIRDAEPTDHVIRQMKLSIIQEAAETAGLAFDRATFSVTDISNCSAASYAILAKGLT